VAHLGRKRIGYKSLLGDHEGERALEDEGSSVYKVSYHYCSFIC